MCMSTCRPGTTQSFGLVFLRRGRGIGDLDGLGATTQGNGGESVRRGKVGEMHHTYGNSLPALGSKELA